MMAAKNQDLEHGRADLDTEHYDVTPSTTGTKRLFSNRESKQFTGYEKIAEVDADQDGLSSGKRLRNSDWPLPRASPPSAKPIQRRRDGTSSPPTTRRASSQVRPSRFMEGSMNDRISQRPPDPYIGNDYAREQYEAEQNGRRTSFSRPRPVRYSTEETSVAGRTESSRNSIFRFGKSIAATFNPSNWKIFAKQPQLGDEEVAQQKILRKRQEKAARIYQELKESGQFQSAAIGSDFYEPFTQMGTNRHSNDSSTNFSQKVRSLRGSRENSTVREGTGRGRLFLEPSQFEGSIRGESPSYPVESVSMSKSPSLEAASFTQPPVASMRGLIPRNDSPSSLFMTLGDFDALRRIPSRKELQKQQKLVKRVSDLESKLEMARQKLLKSVNTSEPSLLAPVLMERGRTRFVPGALPSLPSERLLSGYTSTYHEAIGQAITSEHSFFKDSTTNRSATSKAKPAYSQPAVLSEDSVLRSVENDGSVFKSAVSLDVEADNTKAAELSIKDVVVGGQGQDHENGSAKEPTRTEGPSSVLPQGAASKVEGAEDFGFKVRENKVTDTQEFMELHDTISEETHSSEHMKSSSLKAPQLKATPSRKRKSFIGYADDGSEYDPDSEPSSDPEPFEVTSDSQAGNKSRAKTTTSRRKPVPRPSTSTDAKETSNPARPRKVQKRISATSSPSKTQARSQIPAKKAKLNNINSTMTSPPPSSTTATSQPIKHLSKMKTPNLAHPSTQASDSVGLQYTKPRAAPAIHEDFDAGGDDIPPVPKLPKTVRMASGEVVNIESTKAQSGSVVSKASSKGSKLSKTKSSSKQHELGDDGKENITSQPPVVNEEYQWDEDIF